MIKEQEELGLYHWHALRLRDRVRHIDLTLPPTILHKVFALLDDHFPILEHLSLTSSATSENDIPFTLPKAFLAPNLRHLTLPCISPPRRLQLLTSAVSLVTFELSNIQTSGYFRPTLLVARLQCLPQLKELYIGFSISIPYSNTERELLGLGGLGTPTTLPSLKYLWFRGDSAYLDSLVAQIRVPLLERLGITLFNEIAFALPHLSYLINITDAFKLPTAEVCFYRNEVYVTVHDRPKSGPLSFRIICTSLAWKVVCAAQICHGLIPALSCVEKLTLYCKDRDISSELRYGAIDSATWHNLLRSFIGMKGLHIDKRLLEELSHALQVDEVGLDPGFLPNLRFIRAKHDIFSAFINTRQVAGRPVEFVKR